MSCVKKKEQIFKIKNFNIKKIYINRLRKKLRNNESESMYRSFRI